MRTELEAPDGPCGRWTRKKKENACAPSSQTLLLQALLIHISPLRCPESRCLKLLFVGLRSSSLPAALSAKRISRIFLLPRRLSPPRTSSPRMLKSEVTSQKHPVHFHFCFVRHELRNEKLPPMTSSRSLQKMTRISLSSTRIRSRSDAASCNRLLLQQSGNATRSQAHSKRHLWKPLLLHQTLMKMFFLLSFFQSSRQRSR